MKTNDMQAESHFIAPVLVKHIYQGEAFDPHAPPGDRVGMCTCGWTFPIDDDAEDGPIWAEHVAQEVQQRGDLVPTWIARRIMWVFYAAGVATVVLALLVLREFGL